MTSPLFSFSTLSETLVNKLLSKDVTNFNSNIKIDFFKFLLTVNKLVNLK